MQGILDYAELRKDITFQERGFNPVDALIFSVLSYVDWEEVVNEAERPLSEACALFLQRREGADFARIFAYSPLIPRLLELLKDSVRYREVTMGDYRNVFDEAQEIQFAAVTMKLPDGALFLSFRGTDSSMIGWKEDMKMTYQESVPAQVLVYAAVREAPCADQAVFGTGAPARSAHAVSGRTFQGRQSCHVRRHPGDFLAPADPQGVQF